MRKINYYIYYKNDVAYAIYINFKIFINKKGNSN